MIKLFNLLSILSICFVLTACSDQIKTNQGIPVEGSITVGQFRLSGEAESGVYAKHLFKLKRYIDDEFSASSGLKTVESERLTELERQQNNALYNKILASEFTALKDINQFKLTADYLLVGEMDGFDLDIYRGKNGSTLAQHQWVIRSNIAMRLISVENGERLASKRINITQVIDDNGDIESRINKALNVIAQKVVSELLLQMAEKPLIEAVNGQQVTIASGQYQGIRKGQVFDIYDATSSSLQAQAKITRIDKNKSYGQLVANDPSIVQVGDYLAITEEKTEKNNKNVRIAINTAFGWAENAQIIGLPVEAKQFVTNEAVGELNNLISQEKSFDLARLEAEEMKALFTQQVMTAINQGMEINLPLGTIQGVDYMVFASINSIEYQAEKKETTHIELTGEDIIKKKPAHGLIRGFIYLKDVYTNNDVASIGMFVEKDFNEESWSVEQQLTSLSHQFAQKAWQRILMQIKPIKITQISGMSVLLNAGLNAGVEKGQLLSVYRDAGSETGGMKIAQLKVVDFNTLGYAQCEIISSSTPISLGDLVQAQPQLNKSIDKTEVNVKPLIKEETKGLSLSDSQNKLNSIIKNAVVAPVRFGGSVSEADKKIISTLSTKAWVEDAVVNSKTFRLVTRDTNEIKNLLIKEKQFAETESADKTKKNDFSLTIYDRVIIPEITSVTAYARYVAIPFTEPAVVYERTNFVELAMQLKILSQKGELVFAKKSIKKKSSRSESSRKSSGIPPKNYYEETIKKAIKELVASVSEQLSPIVVLKVEGDTLVLNKSVTLKQGDRYMVMSKAELIKDPYSGIESLISLKEYGQAEIKRVHENYSIAKMIEGDAQLVKEGAVLVK